MQCREESEAVVANFTVQRKRPPPQRRRMTSVSAAARSVELPEQQVKKLLYFKIAESTMSSHPGNMRGVGGQYRYNTGDILYSYSMPFTYELVVFRSNH